MSNKRLLVTLSLLLIFCLPVSPCQSIPTTTITFTPQSTSTLSPKINSPTVETPTIFPTQEPTQTPVPATETPSEVPITEKQIVVILSQQMVYAYEGENLIREFVVSTGLPNTPTVQGTYAIYIKLDSTRMTGPGYDLPDVPWTMYFYQGYGFHGTYWHNNFGHPMSHGCVNMYTPDAQWLYHWASIGTAVLVLP